MFSVNKNKKTAILSFARWLFVFALLVSTGCNKEKLQKIYNYYNMDEAPQISIKSLKSVYKESNIMRARISAPVMNYYVISSGNRRTEFPNGVRVQFYDENMRLSSTLRADFAVYYEKPKLWKLSGNVVVSSISGGTLKTQELYYNEKEQQIYTIKFVEITDPHGTVIRGKGGFVSNFDFTVYEFRNVDGVIMSYNSL